MITRNEEPSRRRQLFKEGDCAQRGNVGRSAFSLLLLSYFFATGVGPSGKFFSWRPSFLYSRPDISSVPDHIAPAFFFYYFYQIDFKKKENPRRVNFLTHSPRKKKNFFYFSFSSRPAAAAGGCAVLLVFLLFLFFFLAQQHRPLQTITHWWELPSHPWINIIYIIQHNDFSLRSYTYGDVYSQLQPLGLLISFETWLL